jgi:hypothetical protein
MFGTPVAIYILYRYLKHLINQHDQKELDAMPEQPFKVDVTVKSIEDSALFKMKSGRARTHSLDINVKIGPKDWQRIKQAGLYDAILFEYVDYFSTEAGEMERYKVSSLRQPNAVGFYNINAAHAAKEQLLKALHDLKDTIEVQKEGPQREVFEI